MHQGIKGFAHSFWVFDGQKLTARPVTDQWLGPWRLCSASWDTLMPPPTSLIYVCIIFNYSLSTDWKSMESWEAVAWMESNDMSRYHGYHGRPFCRLRGPWGSDCDPAAIKSDARDLQVLASHLVSLSRPATREWWGASFYIFYSAQHKTI